MNFLNLKKKKFFGGLFLGLMVFAAVIAPVNYGSIVTLSGGENLISTAEAQSEQTTNNCGVTEFGCHLRVFANQTLPALISSVILTITSWFLGVAGALLNEVIGFTVVDMAANIRGIDGINITWKVMRDLANLGFIFILLYVAIGTILRVGNVDTKKLLVNVIIFALLLNFSLFFTKIIIDASNIVTIGFYNKISSASGLSGAFMDKLGIASVYDVSENAKFVRDAGDAGKIILLGLFGGILFLVTGFVFLAASFMFIIRYVTLIFLLIFSPLAFAAMALPHDKYSSKWWDKLWKNIIFAPVFMIMIWIVLTVLSGILNVSSTNQMLRVINTPGSSMGVVINFIIVIVMMVATLIVANEIGAAGAKGAIKLGNKWRGKAQGLVGRGMLRATPLRTLDKKLSDSRFGQTALGRGLRTSTTGALMNVDFGSGKSISKVDKGLKKSREDYAKKQVKDAEKEHGKQEDIRKDFNAVLLNPHSNIQDRYSMHQKMLKNEQKRLAGLEKARQSAVERKSFAELKEIDDAKAILSRNVSDMETRQGDWDKKMEASKEKGGFLMKRDFDISEQQVKDISRNTGKQYAKEGELRLKMTQRAEAVDRERGDLITRTGRTAGKIVANSTSGAIIGGAAGSVMGGPIGVPVGAAIGAFVGTKRGKKFIGKTKKFLYGEAQSARLETIKSLRDAAKKGKKGSLEEKIKQAVKDEGGDDESGDDEGGGGGDSKGGDGDKGK